MDAPDLVKKLTGMAKHANMLAIPLAICGFMLVMWPLLRSAPFPFISNHSVAMACYLILLFLTSIVASFILNYTIVFLQYIPERSWPFYCSLHSALLGFSIFGLVSTGLALGNPITFFSLSGSCIALDFYFDYSIPKESSRPNP